MNPLLSSVKSRLYASLATGIGLCIVGLTPCFSAEPEIQFNRDILPILSDKCYHCHGPDKESREADLRLDILEGSTADLGGHAAIVPGDPGKSELLKRITHDDKDEVMPPSKTNKDLTDKEKTLLSKWIAEGAEYQEHWSFLPLAHEAPPKVKNEKALKNTLDRFVLAKLEKQGLAMSPEADPSTLVRRLYIDLLGLLPPPELVKKFRDSYAKNPDGIYLQLVDALLDNPHYGERWGRHWLDQARYADSNGYTIDGDRVMWPYRDWVIRAVGDDLPFDQFTIEQIAGDLLPNPSKSQLVASAFHRNTLINQEGGTDDEQFRIEEVVDRVNTTSAVWLGLTVGCAQCHNHKFDPIAQKEFYNLFAFFNSTQDVNNTGPTLEISQRELFIDEFDPVIFKQLEAAREELASLDRAKNLRQTTWEKNRIQASSSHSTAKWKLLTATAFEAEGGAKLRKLDDGSLLAGKGGAREVYNLTLARPDEPLSALRLRVLPNTTLPKTGPGLAGNGNFVLTSFEVWQGNQRIPIKRAQADHAQPDFAISGTIDNNADTGWAINIGKGSAPGAKMNAPHEADFILAKALDPSKEPIRITLRHEKNDHYNIGRFAIDASSTNPGSVNDEKLLTALRIDPEKRDKDQKKLANNAFTAADTNRKAVVAKIERLKTQLGLGPAAKVMVTRELAKPRPTYLLTRGNFLLPDKGAGALNPGVPEILNPLKIGKGDKATRLDLAKWLVSPDNPLTPRVTINRVWMRYFGRGLVGTENDFGTQGSYPTHPALLDWLAGQFIKNGWSMRKLHKLIVTSATYRQSSDNRPELNETDANNNLLARQNRLRFDAEIIRDASLSASGLLTATIGGPSVRPPQPDGVYAFTQNKKIWNAETDGNRFRRALYTQFYRSAPYPMLTTFDSPDFQAVCTQRSRSNTPLQSLTLANDASLFEMCQGMARRIMTEVPGNDATAHQRRIRRAFVLCYSRQPSDAELKTVFAFQKLQNKRFSKNPEAAKTIAPSKTPAGYDKAAAASWTAVTRALMNTDEFITRE